ncbi:MAG: TPM domain-containing protein, partial [Isosphaeraceae bacterium]
DEGRMFSPGTVKNAERRLERLEQKTHVPVVIETIDHLPDLDPKAPSKEKLHAINQFALRRDEKIREGIYILLSKRDSVISRPLVREHLENVVPMSKRDAITEAFLKNFRQRDFDGGLEAGVSEIEKTLEGYTDTRHRAAPRVAVPAPVGHAANRGHVGGGGSMLGTFLLIGLGIFAVLIILRLLGNLFSRSSGAGYPGSMGGPRPGMGPGGPGYYGGGGPGYGGRGGGGGGFFSGLLGGLGGAMAGNWLYDQMSGRHGETTSAGMYPTDQPTADAADERIIGADDNDGQGASWDDGGNTGGGDWGGDTGGGDWGGGGGDWGGGGDGGGGGDW